MLVELLLIVLSLIAWLCYREYSSRPSNFPKGPTCFPLVGSIPLLGKDALSTFQVWKAKYGKSFGFGMGTFRTVMINDYNWIKEAFDQDVFAGRPSLPPLLLLTGGKKIGLIPSEGKTWSEQRRFTLRHLRDFGFGKKSMEATIHEDIKTVIQQLKDTNGAPIDTSGLFSVAVLSSLWSIIAGEKPSDADADSKFKEILNNLRHFIQSLQFGSPSTLFFAWLASVLPKSLASWNPMSQVFDPIKNLLREYIAKHKKSFDGNNLRDFIDVYLQEIHATTDPSSSFYKSNGDENLLIVILNLFGAGSETTSNTINWAILLLSLHPHVLTKLQAELDKVIGADRLPSLDDRPACIYTEAVIQEVLRYSSIAPTGVFHNTMGSVPNFHGASLPKDTMVMANLYGVHYDVDLWGDPENFRPERFLSADGLSLLKDKPLVAFSTGKRVCLGEVLARNELFLFLTTICQKFNFEPNPNKEKPNPKDTTTSLIRFPKPFEVCFDERKS